MTATAEWNIAQLERHLTDGAVYTGHWTVSLEEEGESASAYGSVGFSDPDPADFTPYDELTKEQVVGWVKDALGEEQVTSVEESLANQIQKKLNPTDASGIPWWLFAILRRVIYPFMACKKSELVSAINSFGSARATGDANLIAFAANMIGSLLDTLEFSPEEETKVEDSVEE